MIIVVKKAVRPFFSQRLKIIENEFPDLKKKVIFKLALNTKGQNIQDIKSTVNLYKNSKTVPEISDIVNTCNPVTGYRDSHLIPYFNLRKRLTSLFFTVNIYPASDFADKWKNRLSFLAPQWMNFSLSPYYILKADCKKRAEEQYSNDIADIYDHWDVWQNDIKPIDISLPYAPSISLKYVVDFLEKHSELKNGRILDAGCGSGDAVLTLNNMGLNLQACDISSLAENVIDNFRIGSVSDLPYDSNSFDLVYSLSVLHHLENIEEGIREINRVLKSGGYFIFTLHTRNSLYFLETKLKKLLMPEKFAHYDYLTFSSTTEIFEYLRQNNFAMINYDGVQPFWCLTKLTILAEYLKRKLNLKSNIFAKISNSMSKLIPERVRAEISYHTVYICRKY